LGEAIVVGNDANGHLGTRIDFDAVEKCNQLIEDNIVRQSINAKGLHSYLLGYKADFVI
jgi:hypothetical protein